MKIAPETTFHLPHHCSLFPGHYSGSAQHSHFHNLQFQAIKKAPLAPWFGSLNGQNRYFER
jgi:predicted dithiol-disulfide oxidoreductase (DUF899 family)